MKFLLDESVEYRLAGFLVEMRHDVTAIAVDHPSALKDTAALLQVMQTASDQLRGFVVISDHGICIRPAPTS